MQRQRVLERAGWTFWRCFASIFIRRRTEVLADLFKALEAHGIEPIGAEGAPKTVHMERRFVSMGAGSGDQTDLNRVEPLRRADGLSPQLKMSISANEAAEVSSRPAYENDVRRRDQVISFVRSRHDNRPLSQDSPHFQVARNASSGISNGSSHESRRPENLQSSKPNRQDVADRKTVCNPVVEGLAALEERFRNPRCSHCNGVARISIHTAGPVVVCTDPVCNKTERVDGQTLQRLVAKLGLTCRKCDVRALTSLQGPLGNYLKCGKCGENTSWQFVAGYGRKH
jgi:hypothetical protein